MLTLATGGPKALQQPCGHEHERAVLTSTENWPSRVRTGTHGNCNWKWRVWAIMRSSQLWEVHGSRAGWWLVCRWSTRSCTSH